jgi:AraC-like DNA-binding protein
VRASRLGKVKRHNRSAANPIRDTLKLSFEKLRLFCRRWNRWTGVKPSVSGYQVGGHRHAGSDGTRGRADSYQYRRESDPKNA